VNRVTLDTNIYVSAFEFGGGLIRLLQMGMDGEIEIAVSQPIVDETMRVLRDKFGWSDAELRDALLVMEGCATKVTPTEALNVVPDDRDDDRILECAATARSDYVVTGDKHLLRLGTFGGIRIVNPADFLDMQGSAARYRR
jgi:putative PIN family toxin of toxin-antitoxin system